MPIPVLIPSNNEAPRIERTLTTLAKQALEVTPYVIVNGSTDGTADIARQAGAQVLESEHGKMRAIQAGMRELDKSVLDPFIILDGDTRPFSRHWGAKLTSELKQQPEDRPGVVWGPVAYLDDANPLIGVAVTAYTSQVSWADRHDEDPRTIRGCNMGLRLQTAEIVEELLELDNYWPREDVAIYDTIMQRGDGTAKVLFNPQAWVNTSAHRFRVVDSIRQQLRSRKHVHEMADNAYESRTPENAIPYNSPFTRHPHKNRNLVSDK